MVITATRNGNELDLALRGRLDSSTAEELETLLDENTEGVEKVVLDLAELEFISSIGLRILLKTDRKYAAMQGLHVKNVNEVVMDVFQLTGFDDILTLE